MRLHIDLETYSSVDLRKYGMHKYVDSPDFQILICAWAIDDDIPSVVSIGGYDWFDEDMLEIKDLLLDPDYTKVAHNAAFEIACLSKYFQMDLPVEQWECTAVHASYLALPRSLDGVCKVLKLAEDKAKSAAGKSLITYFCKPCKPTKVNGGRTRNLPHHDSNKWEQFKQYCWQDVIAEREIDRLLSAFPLPRSEQDLWVLDQQINNRGALIDMNFVRSAISIDSEYRERLLDEASTLTGLDNPNSVSQLLEWLQEELDEDEIPDLKKATVAGLVKSSPHRMLEIRQELGKTSVKKYAALQGAACSDSRLRGSLLFYGATRTGRWAGRIFQPQNLPQNHMKDLALARDIVMLGNVENVEMLFDSVSDTLSQLIRTAIVPKRGYKLVIADFSAIEARVIAWLAGEQWRLDVFNTHGKIYEASAAAAFHVPIESITKDSPLRQRGKVLELACAAEGQLVLTHCGLRPIEKVTLDDRAWDGEGWVSHDGVVCRGIKEVISYEGLTATPDHVVWTDHGIIELGTAKIGGYRLVRSGDGGETIRLGTDNKPRSTKISSLIKSAGEVHGVRGCEVGIHPPYPKRKIKGVQNLFSAKTGRGRFGKKSVERSESLSKSRRSKLFSVRRARNSIQLCECDGGGAVDGQHVGTGKGTAVGSDRQQRALRAGKLEMVYEQRKRKQQEKYKAPRGVFPIRVALHRKNREEPDRGGAVQRRDTHQSSKDRIQQGCPLGANTAVVYDILNCGPRNRFTVSDCLVHNCGYGGAEGAVAAMDTKNAIPEDERRPLAMAWRKASPNIVKFWWDVDAAAKKAVLSRGTVCKIPQGHDISFVCEKGFLFCSLPSGRRLAYPRPAIVEDAKYGRDKLVYEGQDQKNPVWGRIDTYGPKLVENIVQAVSRDLLAYGMQQVDTAGHDIILHVHDEAITEVPMTVTVKEIEELLASSPVWAKGLPLRADGYESSFYMKA